MIALALIAAVTMQDTNTALPTRVRSMLEHFPPPHGSQPSISIGFSRDSVWVGEQVELVTAAWFPRLLRDRLRHQPQIRSPSLSGLWSARNQQVPVQAATRFVGNQVYDLYVAWQTIFPIGAGRIDAPPAMLSFGVPTSSSYFAPEERKSFVSGAARLIVRPIPAALAASLGTGPVAQNLRLAWRGPAGGVRAGTPAIMDLVLSGEGNITLWPAPRLVWPPGIHVYPEPTEERPATSRGLIAGEKHFRYTVVADSGGVVALPSVSYQYFDPVAVTVRSISAAAFTLVVLSRPATVADRHPPPVTGDASIPVATMLWRNWRFAWFAIAAILPLFVAWRRRQAPVRAARKAVGDPEAALRAALGAPVASGSDHVIAALRARGVPREEAEHVHRWLTASSRRRYGPAGAESPAAPPVLGRVLARITRAGVAILCVAVAARLDAVQDDGVARFEGRDYAGAERAFSALVQREPAAAAAWRDLGAARWMQGDDPGAAAAWIEALRLAPRDPLLRSEWNAATVMPPDVRSLAPRIPLSRDELLLAAVSLWIAGWMCVLFRWRQAMLAVAATWFVVTGVAISRTAHEGSDQALLIANTALKMAPNPATAAIPGADISAWSRVDIVRRTPGWALVSAPLAATMLGNSSVSGWVPASAIAPIGPGSVDR